MYLSGLPFFNVGIDICNLRIANFANFLTNFLFFTLSSFWTWNLLRGEWKLVATPTFYPGVTTSERRLPRDRNDSTSAQNFTCSVLLTNKIMHILCIFYMGTYSNVKYTFLNIIHVTCDLIIFYFDCIYSIYYSHINKIQSHENDGKSVLLALFLLILSMCLIIVNRDIPFFLSGQFKTCSSQLLLIVQA